MVDKPRETTRGDGRVEEFPRERFLKFCAALRIQSRDEGLSPFRLLGSQIYILDEICKGLAEGVCDFKILKSRQLGSSTFFLALDLFWAFEHPGMLGVFVTHEDGSRDQFRNQINLFLSTLPKGYKVPDRQNNQNLLVLKNASLFRYLVAGARKSANNLGRSGSANYKHASEVAFYGSEDEVTSLNQQLSELYPHRLYIDETTANGYNFFEEMWRVALESPAQRAIFVGWWRDERNEFSAGHPNYKAYMPQGTKTPLTDRENRGIREVREQYGERVNAGQLAWYRYMLDVKCRGDESMMDQEQPWIPEDAFQATGSQFFSNGAIGAAMKRAAKKNEMNAFNIVVPDTLTEMEIIPLRQVSLHKADLRMWEAPSSWGRYVMGVKPATGAGTDETVISVWRVFSDCAEQVAEYANDDISTLRAARVVAYLGGLYRPLMWHIDVLGPGMSVLQELDDLKHKRRLMLGPDGSSIYNVMGRMRDFYFRRPDSLSGNVMRHWKTTLDTRRLLMDRFKNQVESDRAQVRSLTCLKHMEKLVVADTEAVEATSNYDDSRPVAAALAVYAWAEWLERRLILENFTRARALEIEKQGGEPAVDGLLRRFMQANRITVHDNA